MTECNHVWVYTNYSHKRKCALCGKEETLIYEATNETYQQYIPRWIEKPKPPIDLKELKVYIDGERVR